MVRRGIFQALRRRGAVLGAVLAYALLLNALAAAVLNVQAVAAAVDPLAVAATCTNTGSDPSGDPVRHSNRHQPDCTLCNSACPMGGLMQGLAPAVATLAPRPPSFVFRVGMPPASGVNPPSIYLSDTAAQAPPAIG